MIKMSHMSGEVQFGWMKMLMTRNGWPRSGMIMRAATVTHAAADSTPKRERGFSALMPNTSALEAMISPPADRPMKNANVKMYIPQDTTSRIPVAASP
jgi:hypothetical protein